MALCRAVLFEASDVHGDPIMPEGFEANDVNECVEIMYEERLLNALPPGDRYENAWAAKGLSSGGAEFLIVYREDADAAAAVRRHLPRRGTAATIGEIILALAKSLSTSA